MNKVTLSVAALAAISVPVQMQAAELTQTEKDANKVVKEEIQYQIDLAINYIGKNCPDVSTEYQNRLSTLTADLIKDAESIVLTETVKKVYLDNVEGIRNEAVQAQKPYTSRDNLIAKWNTLNTEYTKDTLAVTTICPDKNDAFRVYKLNELKSFGVEAIKTKIDGYDLTKQYIVADEKSIEATITATLKKVQDAVKEDLKEQKDKFDANEKAYNDIAKGIADAKSLYNEKVQEAITNLSGVYADWQELAKADLKKYYAEISDVETLNGSKDSHANASKYYKDNTSALDTIKDNLDTALDTYLNNKDKQETEKNTYDAERTGFQDSLNSIKTDLKENNVTSLDGDVTTIQGLIDTLKAKLQEYYEKHQTEKIADDASYKDSKKKIKEKLPKLKKAADTLVDNYKAYDAMTDSIAAVQKTFDAAKKKATETLSKDKKYNAGDHMTVCGGKIQTSIKTMTSTVESKYKEVKAVEYQSKFSTDNIKTSIKNYVTYADSALVAYNAASDTISKAQPELEKLIKVSKEDTNVTVNGEVDGKSYAYYIALLQKQIENINDTIALANTLDGEKHMLKMQAARKLSCTDVSEWNTVEAYKANKELFVKNNAIEAATNIVNKVTELKKTLSSTIEKAKGSVGELGNQYDTINKEVERLKGLVDKVEVPEWDETYDKAAGVVAELTPKYNELLELQPDVDKLFADAEAAKANKKAKDEVDKKVEAVTAEKVETDKALKADKYSSYYTTQNTTYGETDLDKIKEDEIEPAYKDIKMVEKKDGIISKLDVLIKNIKGLPALAKENNTANKALTDKFAAVETAHADAYKYISENDKTSEGATYLSELAAVRTGLDTLNLNITNYYNQGLSKSKQQATLDALDAKNEAIKSIQDRQKAGYNEAIAADNKAQHDTFVTTWNNAYGAFQEAVTILDQFTHITNKALSVAKENLNATHTKIMGYADKLNKLMADENVAYHKVSSPDFYNSYNFRKDAIDYKTEINKEIADYQKTVNAQAKNVYQTKINDAYKDLSSAEIDIKSYHETVKNNAFSDVKADINAAKTALGSASDETVKDPMFAVKLDKWLPTFEGLDKKLSNDKEKAADAEFTLCYNKAVEVYSADKEAIAKLGNINNKTYLDSLDSHKKEYIDAAKKSYDQTKDDTFSQLSTILENLNNIYEKVYSGVSGEKEKKTSVRAAAEKEAEGNGKNLEAYNVLTKQLADIETAYDKVVDEFAGLVVYGQIGEVFTAAQKIYSDIDSKAGEIETWKTDKQCVDKEKNKAIKETFKKANDSKIIDLKKIINPAEYTALQAEIKRIDEYYNKAAATDLNAVKGYREKIAQLSKTIDAINEAYDYSKNYSKTIQAYLLVQDTIAQYDKTLAEIADAAACQKVADEIKADIAPAEKALNAAVAMAKYDKVIEKQYGLRADEITATLNEIKAGVDNTLADGTILLFKNNFYSALEKLVAEETKKLEKDVKSMYKDHQTNDEVYSYLLGELNSAREKFEQVSLEIADYNYLGDWTIDVPETYFDSEEGGIMPLEETEVKFITIPMTQYYETVLSRQMVLSAQNLEDYHDKYELVSSDKKDSEINDYSDLIDEYLKDASHQETVLGIDSITVANEALFNVSTADKKYGPIALAELQETYENIKKLSKLAVNYEDSVYNGREIVTGIDGEILNNGKPTTYKYLTEAWPKVKSRLAELTLAIAQFSEDVFAKSYLLGDANKDGKVNVKDYDEVRNMIFNGVEYEDIEDEAVRLSADANEDKAINVADLSVISNIIFKPEAVSTTPVRRSSYLNNKVNVGELTTAVESEETTIFGKTVRIALNVNSEEEMTNGQMDITLPAGMKLAGVSATARTENHAVAASEIAEGVQRVLITSFENNAIEGTTGAVAYLDVEIESGYNGGDITVQNILFTDSKARSLALTNNGGNATTGIDSIQAATVKERIYSVGGQMKKALQRGLNIIVGENGEAKTVLKK